jgi:ubiquinone/menaquinone biosynthesis C-methylase UbiE
MEERKEKEIDFYNKQSDKNSGDFEGFKPENLSSYSFLYNYLRDKCKGKKILDYGCGNGIHSVFLAECGGNVTGIDLSENQLEIAKKRTQKKGIEDRVNFIKMDCEKLDFPGNSFDIIFDGGTFSSLDLNKVFSELVRVLKPDGFILGIETFGHNPFTNLKRRFNKASGKRTEWAASHIFQNKDFLSAQNYFNKIEIKYFHLISWAAFPFLNLPGGRIMLKLLETADKILFVIPFFRKYAFKVVFIFSKPKK